MKTSVLQTLLGSNSSKDDHDLPNPLWQASSVLLIVSMLVVTFQPLYAQAQSSANGSSVIPSWWLSRGVVNEAAEEVNQAVANTGQLSWIASQAHAELSSLLPEQAGFSVRFDLNDLFTQAKMPYEADYEEWQKKQYSACNIGQLKAVALHFYKELNTISPDWVKQQLEANGLILGESYYQVSTNNTYIEGYYPWNPDTPKEVNFSIANLGQLKNIFALRFNDDAILETEADGLSDLYELALLKYHPDFQSGGAYSSVDDISSISWNAGDLSLTLTGVDGGVLSNGSSPQLQAPFSGLVSSRASLSALLSEHEAIGSVGGSFSTGGDGSASYSIPIDIPKGTSGLEPTIGIGYSSSGGNGALGVGFDLSGFQRITRGSTSQAKENSIGVDPVDFDGNDRFFFDGDLLVAVEDIHGNVAKATDYGQHGTVYRTEDDSFARITSWGQTLWGWRGSGPAFWTVETKSGLRIEMGNCNTSCVYSPGGKGNLVWNVNKVSDNLGNYYEVNYDTSAPAGFVGYRPESVLYTGNKNVTPELVPYNKVTFNWEDREDVTSGVINGVKVCNNKRLQSIEVESIGSLIHSYEMTYDYSSQTRRSRLQQVQKHYPGADPLPPTTFNWRSHLAPVIPQEESDSTAIFNGRQRWYQSESNDFNNPYWSNNASKDIEYTKLVDMNGDGLLDRVSYVDPAAESIVSQNRTYDDYGVWIALNNGSGFAAATKWFSAPITENYNTNIRRYVASVINYPTHHNYSGFYDVNSDGLPDRVQFFDFENAGSIPSIKGHQWYQQVVYKSSSNSLQLQSERQHSFFTVINQEYTDISILSALEPSLQGICVALNTGNGFTEMKKWHDVSDIRTRPLSSSSVTYGQSLISWTKNNQDHSAFIDMNADSIPDRVDHYNYDTNEYGLWVSIGLGYYDEALKSGYMPKQKWYTSAGKNEQNYITWTGNNGKDTYATLMDLDSDGILDRVYHYNYNDSQLGHWYDIWVARGSAEYSEYTDSFFGRGFGWARMLHLTFANQIPSKYQPQRDGENRFIDMNADGYPDRVYHYNSIENERGIWVSLNRDGDGFTAPEKWLETTDNNHSKVDHVNGYSTLGTYLDMNGDGLPDRVQYINNSTYSKGLYVAVNKGLYDNGAGFEDFVLWYHDPNDTSHNYVIDSGENKTYANLQDMNADGLPDRVSDLNPNDKNDKGLFVAINNGSGFDAATKWANYDRTEQHHVGWSSGGKTYSAFVDINGDGFPDRLDHYNYDTSFEDHPHYAENGTSVTDNDRKGLWVSLNTGNGFIGGGVNDDEVTPPSINTSELIHSITDGLGAEIRVEYKRMNDPALDDMGRSIYTREQATAEEFQSELQARVIRSPGSSWAVARYAEQDGLGSFRWTRNYYGGRKFDQANEIDLGFRWVETYDETRGAGSISVFSQKFPYHGNPIENTSYLSIDGENIIINRDVSSFHHKYFPYDGSEVYYPGGKIRFTYNEESTSEIYSYDTYLTGSASRSAVDCLANTVLPGRNFVGSFLHSTTIYKRSSDSTQKIYSSDGDLVYTSSSSSEEGYTSSSLNTYEPNQITSPEGFDHTDSNVSYPIDNTKLFGKWILGRLSGSTTTTSRASTSIGSDSITKKSRFTYYTEADGNPNLCGMLKTEIAEPDHALALVQANVYDQFGNTVEAHSYPIGDPGKDRWVKSTYDSRGRFVISTENQLGHTSHSTYDDKRALLLSSTDANGLTISHLYDAYGTRVLTQNPDGTQSAEITANVSTNSIEGATGIVHKRVAQVSGAPAATVYLDIQGRDVLTESAAFDGRKVYTRSDYDVQGRKYRTSLPFFSGDNPLWNTILFDAAQRSWCTSAPDGSETKVYHQGYQSVLYNAKDNNIASGQQQVRIEDHHGRLVETIDNHGGSVKFYYSVDGKLLKTIAPGGHVVGATYDIFGSKTQMTDSDTGKDTAVYDAFGSPLTSSDAENNRTDINYDLAGRAISSTTFRGGVKESTTTTTYDTAPGAGLGKVHSVSILWHEDSSAQTTTTSYDHLGRSIRTDETRTLYDSITDQLVTEQFSASLAYDDLGRVRTETNAGGLTLLNLYNEYGFAAGILDYRDGTLYWQPLTYDASGRLLTERLGNGVVNTQTYNNNNGTVIGVQSSNGNSELQNLSFQWDTIGNLLQRSDNLKNLTESFEYDGLNRLTKSSVGTESHTVSYDAGGNITHRSDRGAYTYHAQRVHQLVSVGSSRTFGYDDVGNIVSETRDNDDFRRISWGAHAKITDIQQNKLSRVNSLSGTELYTYGTTDMSFDYGAGIDRIRKTMIRRNGTSLTDIETTDYLGSYERIEHQKPDLTASSSMALAKTEHRHSIGGFLVKSFTEWASSAGQFAEKSIYQLQDHLGSITALTDASGNILIQNAKQQIFSYDSWGQRRDAQTWLAYSDSGGTYHKSTETNRGYTSHEMLDEMGLINMNGRVYDSEIGRFLSADPHVQAPENSQNYNRYAYVLNNPLSYTDPSGYFFKKLFKSIKKFFKKVGNTFKKVGKWIKENWRTIVTIAFAFVVGFAFLALPGLAAYGAGFATGALTGISASTSLGAIVGGALAGAASGAFNAAINGGDLGDVLKGAAIGALQGAASAYVGGAIILNGSASLGQLFTAEGAQLIAAHGVIGGASNVAMGGKFGQGFISAAVGKIGAVSGVTGSIGGLGGFDESGAASIIARTLTAGVIGGTTAALSGGKFANGAYTAAFQHLLNAEAGRGGLRNGLKSIGNALKPLGDVLGKIWNLPNTALGLSWGGVGLATESLLAPFRLAAKPFGYKGKIFDFRITVGNNAIQFHSHPLMVFGAVSLGNTNHYGDILPAGRGLTSPYTGNYIPDVAKHEEGHTYQSQLLGPLFLPVYFASGGISGNNPFERMADNYALGGSWNPWGKETHLR